MAEQHFETVKAQVKKDGKEIELDANVVLMSIGRRPVTTGLNLEAIGVELDKKGRVIVDDEFNTTCKGVKCIGDATFGPMLAHKAEEEGIAAVEMIKSGFGHVNYDVIPSVIYTTPEVAWVGKTEEQLKAAGVAFKKGKFPFAANSRAKINHETDGFVKVLADAQTDKLLGVHIYGPQAGELISEATMTMAFGGSSEDIARTCHPHPTRAEAVRQAAMGVEGWTMQA